MKKQKLTEAQNLYLNQEIIEEILSRLPVKALMRFKSVCKSWNDLISESRFSKLHLKRSIDDNRMKLVYMHDSNTTLVYEARTGRLMEEDYYSDAIVSVLAYCNGLFCISIAEDVFLWNPSTQKPRKISASPIEFPTSSSTWASVFFGLGYHSASDDYKLVRISMFDDVDLFRTEVKIYSRNTDTWRRVQDFPYDYPLGRPGVFTNGCLHWIVSVWENGARHHRVALLDLTDNSYGSIRLPDFGCKTLFFDIGSLDDKLVVFYSSNDCTSDIWILEAHGRAESWTRIKIATDCISSLEAFIYFQPLYVLKPGKILLRLGAKKVVSFDVEKKRCYDIYTPHILDCKMVSFVESLVSPYSILPN